MLYNNSMTRRMSLCPNCRTIQKNGIPCTICKCPVIVTDDNKDLNKDNKQDDKTKEHN